MKKSLSNNSNQPSSVVGISSFTEDLEGVGKIQDLKDIPNMLTGYVSDFNVKTSKTIINTLKLKNRLKNGLKLKNGFKFGLKSGIQFGAKFGLKNGFQNGFKNRFMNGLKMESYLD